MFNQKSKAKWSWAIVVMMLVTVLIGVSGCGGGTTTPPADPAPVTPPPAGDTAPVEPVVGEWDWLPEMAKVGIHEVGTAGHLLGSLVLETMVEKYSQHGVTVRGIPQGAEVPRSMMGRTGTTDCVLQAGHTVYALQEGLLTYGSSEWGPQPVRALYCTTQPPMVIGVRGDSGINSFEDLRGKSVDTLPASPATNWALEALLAYGGLTRADVESIPMTSRSEEYEAILEGRLNFGSWNIDAPQAYELIEMGGYYLPMELDSPNWERVAAAYPMFRATSSPNGAGASEEKPVVGLGQSNPMWFCWPDQTSTEVTYFLTRAMFESYDSFKDKHASLKALYSPEEHWKNWDSPGGLIPMDDGAIKYFKEIGEWTPEREQIQQERLQYQAKLAALWDKTVQEAEEQGVKSTDFFKFWLEKKAEAGLPVLN